MLLNDAVHGYLLLVWLKGYSRGYIKAHHISLTLTIIDRGEEWQRYVCPQALKADENRCNLQLKIRGRPVGTATIKIRRLKSIEECLPGPHIHSDSTMYTFSAFCYTHSRLGDNKKMTIYNKSKQLFKRTFQYFVSANVSLGLNKQ